MKEKRKIIISLVALALVLTIALTVVFVISCKKEKGEAGSEITIIFAYLDGKVVFQDKVKVENGFVENGVKKLDQKNDKLEININSTGFIESFKYDGTQYGDAEEKIYVFVYNDDADNQNETWGKITIGGKEYMSSTLGIRELPAKEGKTYVFAISSYN